MTKSPTITIFAGISGIDKAKFIQKLLKKSKMTKSVLVIDFDKELRNKNREPTEAPPDMATYLDSPDPTIKFRIFEATFPWINGMIKERKNKYEHIFLLTHLSYFKNSEFYPPFIPILYKQLFTSMPSSKIRIITLIDDVFSIWKKISKREKEEGYHNTKLSLREILAWRSLESLRAEALKKHVEYEREGSGKIPHYVISIRHPHHTFHNLIFKKNVIRIYLSYPISQTRKTPIGIKDVNGFRKEMHALGKKFGWVIFDPVAIDELCIKFALDNLLEKTPKSEHSKITSVTVTNKDRWPIGLSDMIDEHILLPVDLPRREIEEVIRDIGNQIASRDYTLVDTASYLAVYRPFYNKIPSKGVEKEIDRANNHMVRVLVHHPIEDHIEEIATTHPFGSKTKTFDVKKDLFDSLQKLSDKEKKRDK